MSTYKITNITNLSGKREPRFNSTIDIEYVDGMIEKKLQIKPGETIFFTTPNLPLSIHKLRVKKIISVVEVSKKELLNSMEIKKPMPQPTPQLMEEVIDDKRNKKKSGRKSHDEEISEN